MFAIKTGMQRAGDTRPEGPRDDSRTSDHIAFPLAESAKGRCPRLTRAMGFMTPSGTGAVNSADSGHLPRQTAGLSHMATFSCHPERSRPQGGVVEGPFLVA